MTTCGRCGRAAPEEATTAAGPDGLAVPLGWMLDVTLDGRRRVICDRCAREEVRTIEGRLDL